MAMRSFKVFVVVLLLFSCIFSAACRDARELSSTAIVLGVAFDQIEEGMQLTVELCGADSSEPAVLQTYGGTVEECVSILRQLVEEDLFWGSAAVIIYGGTIDGGSAYDCGMHLYRKLGVSGKTPVLRAWDCKAGDVLSGRYGQAPYVAMGLGESLGLSSGKEERPLTLMKQLEAFAGVGRPGRAAVVEVDENGRVRLVDARP